MSIGGGLRPETEDGETLRILTKDGEQEGIHHYSARRLKS